MAKTNGSEKENKVKKVKEPKQSMKEPKVNKVKDPNEPMKETKVKKIKDSNEPMKETKAKKIKDPNEPMKETKAKKIKDPNEPMKESKVKKIKDPNEPKKALTSYFIWLSANRPILKEKNPGASATDIARAAGKEWKELGPDDKKTWELKAAEDKIRYSKAMESYNELKQ
uniref:HMG box domain-containing protein n=1 Tax=Rhabditophanes sp. KR3021 TaxID=114890 RepID=A0AC35TVJ8_9BILA